jgi:hypothetical protein
VPQIKDKIAPLDLTVAQVSVLRSESRSTVLRKLKSGKYQSYLSGGRRKVIAASVLADRELEMKTGAPVRPPPTPRTRPGRRRKDQQPPEQGAKPRRRSEPKAPAQAAE